MYNILPTTASFLVTENCNLACKYCFENKRRNKREMTDDVAARGVDFLIENAVKMRSPSINIMLFGGEPLLKPKLCEDIMEYAIIEGSKKGIMATGSVITNGTVFNNDVEHFLKTYKKFVSCQLSVDGDEETQDEYRVKHDGSGSFALVKNNIPKFLSIYGDNQNNLNIHGCLNKKSLHKLFHNYTLFRDGWGIERIWFMPVHSEHWETSDVEVYREQLRLIKNEIIERVKNGSIEEYKLYAPLDKGFNCSQQHRKPCGAGESFVTITADGLIYPCHHFYFNDDSMETCIGHVATGMDEAKRKMYLGYDHCDLTCDKDCDQFNCYRCIADNWVQNGSILTQIKGVLCSMSKVEKEVQEELKREVEGIMSLLKNEDKRTGTFGCGMVVGDNSVCGANLDYPVGPGNNPSNPDCYIDYSGKPGLGVILPANVQEHKLCNCGSKEDNDTKVLISIIEELIRRLDKIEDKLNFVIKNTL